MVRCENQFSESDVLYRVDHKHQQSAVLDGVSEILHQFKETKERINHTLEEFTKFSVSQLEIEELLGELIGKSEKDKKCSRYKTLVSCIKDEITYFGSNGWGEWCDEIQLELC